MKEPTRKSIEINEIATSFPFINKSASWSSTIHESAERFQKENSLQASNIEMCYVPRIDRRLHSISPPDHSTSNYQFNWRSAGSPFTSLNFSIYIQNGLLKTNSITTSLNPRFNAYFTNRSAVKVCSFATIGAGVAGRSPRPRLPRSAHAKRDLKPV